MINPAAPFGQQSHRRIVFGPTYSNSHRAHHKTHFIERISPSHFSIGVLRLNVCLHFRALDATLPLRAMKIFPKIKASIFVLRKQSKASSGLQTTGSFSLNDVLSTIGIPVRIRKLSINL